MLVYSSNNEASPKLLPTVKFMTRQLYHSSHRHIHGPSFPFLLCLSCRQHLAGPSKSSMELALLILVPGLLGGPCRWAQHFHCLRFLLIAGGAPNPPPTRGGCGFSREAPSISEDFDAARCGGPEGGRGADVKFATGWPAHRS